MHLPAIILNEMNKQLRRIETCLSVLSEDQLWHRLQPSMNSVGNLCLHLAGNEYQHVVSGIGGKPFVRARTKEFTQNDGGSGEELLNLLYDVRTQSANVLEQLSDSSLEDIVTIRYSIEDWNRMVARPNFETQASYSKSIQTILIQVGEHYSYHTGQIVILTKVLSDTRPNITGTYH